MKIQQNTDKPAILQLNAKTRKVFLAVAIIALLGPNALYIYYAITAPELNTEAMRNPIAQAFMIEAMMLLALFLWQIWVHTRSLLKVGLYFFFAMIGSLAFSFPLFVYRNSQDA